jgi:hypothetical protein
MTGSRSFASVEPAHNQREANHPSRGERLTVDQR